MNAQEIRKAYLDYFKNKKHVVIPRARLVPENDPTTLFTGSGMQPMVPYLLGAEHAEGKRIADSQICFRAEDIDEVGDNRHTTCFEMLGNWSLGDYFKKEQINWFWEFMIDIVGLDPNKLYVTCFIGDPKFKIPKDSEAETIWRGLFKTKNIDAKSVDIGSSADGSKKGMNDGRIFFYDGSKNWWSRGGPPKTTPVGDPCGPDSEVFYEFTDVKHNPDFGEHCHPNCECGRFSEIGNSVFMAYKRTASGFEPLPEPNIDFGGGLERISAAALNNPDMFRISVIWPIITKLEEITAKTYDGYRVAMQVIADHLRGVFFLGVDGVVPSNLGQGYVMRRIMRRAIRYALELGVAQDFSTQLVPVLVNIFKDDFSEVVERKKAVIETFAREEKLFRQTLRNGVKEFNKMVKGGKITGENIFKLYDTFGFPNELSLEEAGLNNVAVDKNWRVDFDKLMKLQKDRSRTASQGQFKGGLGGHSDIHKKYHTATHLMYRALRMVLGDHVTQRGSNITEDRLRFDFSHGEKVTPEQIKKVEEIVNEQITKDLPVSWQEVPTKEAIAGGALGAFGDKYGDKVKVYTVGDPIKDWFSKEICGGPHVEHTGQLAEGQKKFTISKEEASSAGVRRIKAVLQ